MRPISAILGIAALLASTGSGIAQNSIAPKADEALVAPVQTSSSGLAAEQERAEAWQPPSKVGPKASEPTVDDNEFITFAYLQSPSVLDGMRWQSLTDIGSNFVGFDETGTISTARRNVFLNRNSDLKVGGGADNAGTRVHIVLANQDSGGNFSNTITNTVMTDSTARNNLISNIVSLINTEKTGANAPGYVHGVSFDFEPFGWSASASTGFVTFYSDLRTALDAIDPSLAITWYVDPTPSSTQFSTLPSIIGNLDYVIFSGYDWGSGATPNAITDYSNNLSPLNTYMNTWSVPPEKMVIALSSYQRQFEDTTQYGVAGTANGSAAGFTDGLYNTTLRPSAFTHHYVTGDEAAWYTDGTHTYVWPGLEGFEFQVRQVLSFGNTSSSFAGRKLRGIGYWSALWMAEQTSYDPEAGSTISANRTYTHLSDILQKALGKPGKERVLVEGFEAFNSRWQDPNSSPDTIGADNSSFRIYEAAPGGANAPPSTNYAVRVNSLFNQSSGNQVFFRHQVLAHNVNTSVIDTNAVAGLMDSTSIIRAYIHSGPSATPTAYNDTRVAMVVMDANRELERSAFQTLSQPGWQELTFDLTSGAFGFVTDEEAFEVGDGVIETAGGGKRDIGFTGFLIQNDGPSGALRTIWFDEVSYEHANPGGKDYVINEFREANSTTEFVEIYGPAGPLPAGMQLRTFDSGTGAVANSYNLSGSIPDDGGGFGYFVVGDPGVPNVDFTNGGSGITLISTNPGSIQLYNTSTGGVYDSVVYMAYGGLGRLIAAETLGVADEGFPWLGEIGPGTDSTLAEGTAGRYPNGYDTDINSEDFSHMKATPGLPNGNQVAFNSTRTFDTVPTDVVPTYQSVKIANPVTNGITANNGNALRVVDTTGGGIINRIGDASLGTAFPYSIEGKVYLPLASANAQAIGIGICVTQGTNFFTNSTASTGYENGYWLIWENRSGVAMNDGQADHPGVFQFVQASHDNYDGVITELLGSAANATVSATPGTWVNFRLMVDPSRPEGDQLLAQINDVDVWRGSIPEGGRTTGSVAFGFRENHTGNPTSDEGTWIDDLIIYDHGAPVSLSAFELE